MQLSVEPSKQTKAYVLFKILYNLSSMAKGVADHTWKLNLQTSEQLHKDPFNCRVIGPDREAGTLPNEIGSNKKKQSELICCSGEFSVSQKAWPRLGIHHCGKSDSVLILNGL